MGLDIIAVCRQIANDFLAHASAAKNDEIDSVETIESRQRPFVHPWLTSDLDSIRHRACTDRTRH